MPIDRQKVHSVGSCHVHDWRQIKSKLTEKDTASFTMPLSAVLNIPLVFSNSRRQTGFGINKYIHSFATKITEQNTISYIKNLFDISQGLNFDVN